MTNCKSCGATIFWARTEAGKLIPINSEQVDGGNIVLMDNGNTAMVVQTDAATKRHVSHFATCPCAATHRRARG